MAHDRGHGSAKLGVHDALICTMVMTAAVDRQIADVELKRIGDIVATLPVFADFDLDRLVSVAGACGALVSSDMGVEEVLGLIANSLPQRLRETAYALAVEVAAADLEATDEEIRFLEMLSDALELDKLQAGAIEWSARVRYRSA